MSRRPSTEVDALVVRLVDFGDADRIVGLFTRSLGLVAAVARGARRSSKRFAGALQSGQRIRAELGPATHGLHRLDAASLVDPHLGLVRDLARLDEAAVVLRILREDLPEGEPDPELFDRADAHLSRLEREGPDRERLLALRLVVLDRLGVGPELEACVRCGRPAPPERPGGFDPRLGGLVCRACGGGPLRLSASARRWARAARSDVHDVAMPTRRDEVAAGEPNGAASDDDLDALGHAFDALAAVHLARRGAEGNDGARAKGK